MTYTASIYWKFFRFSVSRTFIFLYKNSGKEKCRQIQSLITNFLMLLKTGIFYFNFLYCHIIKKFNKCRKTSAVYFQFLYELKEIIWEFLPDLVIESRSNLSDMYRKFLQFISCGFFSAAQSKCRVEILNLKKGCESEFPYCFLTDFTKFFL